ncbi:MAG TPA: hypothetical protein VFQ66_06180 [Candidatus Limnocylindria bacterium]|nr:hypothetical protein [Candidatus Limnocylindria bacterium]
MEPGGQPARRKGMRPELSALATSVSGRPDGVTVLVESLVIVR